MIRNVRMFAVLCIIALISLSCGIFSLDIANETPVLLPPEVRDDSTETPIAEREVIQEPLNPPQSDACPDGAATYSLIANHHFWTPTGFGDWVWQALGSVSVSLDENGQVLENTAQVIPGSQSGEFTTEGTHCVFEAPANVFVNVYGSCVEGVLSLEISEDWQMGTYDWVCDEDAIQFELPDMMMPPAEHNVEFLLGNAQTYRFEIPFSGGQGFKVYKLDGN